MYLRIAAIIMVLGLLIMSNIVCRDSALPRESFRLEQVETNSVVYLCKLTHSDKGYDLYLTLAFLPVVEYSYDQQKQLMEIIDSSAAKKLTFVMRGVPLDNDGVSQKIEASYQDTSGLRKLELSEDLNFTANIKAPEDKNDPAVLQICFNVYINGISYSVESNISIALEQWVILGTVLRAAPSNLN